MAGRDGLIDYCNDAAVSWTGLPRDRLLGAPLLATLFPRRSTEQVEHALTRALDGEVWSGPQPLLGEAVSHRPVRLTLSPVWREDEVAGVLLVADPGPFSTATTDGDQRADRLARIARVTRELLQADDLDAVTKVVIEHTADATGASVASLSLRVDEGTLALIGIRGAREGTASRWATYPVSSRTPAGEVVRTARPMVLRSVGEIVRRFPDLEEGDVDLDVDRCMIALPLQVAGRVIGVVTMSFTGGRDFDDAEVEFYQILADTCAQAIDRINAVAEAADRQAKLTFLADASAELARSLDYQATLRKVARLAVPDFADWCSIQLLEDGRLRTLAVAHIDPAKVALAEDLQRRYPPDPDAPQGAYNVVRTGESELIPEVPDEMLVAATSDEEHLRLARELNLRSALTVPLKARDRVLGVITWVTGDTGRRFGPTDLVFGEDLARRAAVAIDNAQLHSELRETAVRLQRAVLPERLPTPRGWAVAASYRPAGRTDVGGDFYDVVTWPDGRLGVFVGDVMGRGFAAAAAMASMRAAIRAYIAVDPDPAAVLGKLDRMFARYGLGQLVTMVYGVLEPAEDRLVLVNAGHPPPVVMHHDGSVQELPAGDSAPLGVDGQTRAALHVPFAPGDTLIAFTDGLIERRTEDIDLGQRRLLEHCSGLRPDQVPDRLEDLVDRVRDHTRDDDVAAVALHRLAARGR
jgi:GAF domain-containing protein